MNFNGRIADTLVKAGHDVTFLKIKMKQGNTGNGTTLAHVIETPLNENLIKRYMNVVGIKNMWSMKDDIESQVNDFSEFVFTLFSICEYMFEQDELTEWIKNQNFDVFIAEFYTICPALLINHYGIKKSIFTSAMTNNELLYDYYGLFFPSSYIPTMYHNANDKMTFIQRWNNFMFYYVSKIHFKYFLTPQFEDIYAKYNEGKRVYIGDASKNTGAVFINTLPFIDFPGPITSKIHYIGGIGLNKVNGLDKKWNDILNLRKYNILISFGSIAESFKMPSEYKKGIIEALNKFDDVTFIWKYEKNESTLPIKIGDNIILSSWVPQNDLLNDNRINAFLTHGGMNSIVEAASNGKPIICIPLFGDQKRNAGMVNRLGFSIFYNKNELTNSILLKSTIEEMIRNNDIYREKAMRISKLMKDVPFASDDIIVKVTEFIAKNDNIPEMNLHTAQEIHIQGENQNHDRRDLDNSFTINESTTGTITIYTNNGPIKGINGTFVGNKYYEWYLGIPYAKPPINELRFKAPQPLGKTFSCTQDLEKFLNESNIFNITAQESVTEGDRKNYTLDANIYNETHPFEANKFSNSCMQNVDQVKFPGFDSLDRNSNMSEDCLRLNIFLGAGANGSVLVFFHGGLNFYQSGSGSLSVYNATALAYKSRSIVVTVNYRLGIFGFGFLGHKSGVEGNMGLLDQQLALKWIYTNIGYFGGDNTKITIFGQGYGAAMATSHLFAEDSYPFFDGIIASSGTIKNLWAVSHPETILNNTLVVANNLTCTNDTKEDKIKCLQGKDPYEILNASLFVRNENQSIFQHSFTPISNDTLFFKGDLNLMIAQNDMKTNVDLVIGKVANESTLFMPFILNNDECNRKYNSTLSIYNETNQCYMNNNNLTEISKVVTKVLKLPEDYSPKIEAIYNVTEDSRDQVSRILSDVMFDCDIIKFALEYVNKTIAENIYFYEYRWNSSINSYPNWMGIVHGSDLELIFGYPYIDPSRYENKTVPQDKEKKSSEKIMMLFGQFANQTNKNEIWKAYNFTSNQALLIDEQFEKLNFNGSVLQGLDNIKYKTFISDTCNKLYSLVDEYMNKTYVEVTTSDENIMNNTLVNSSLIDQTNYTYSLFVDGCEFNNTRVCPPNITSVIDGKTEL